MSKIILKISDLLDSHEGLIEKCEGCEICVELEELGRILDNSKPNRFQKILAKGQDMSYEEVKTLILGGVGKNEIGKALGMDRNEYTRFFKMARLREKDLRKEYGESVIVRLKKDADKEKLKKLTKDSYLEYKKSGLRDQDIADMLGITIGRINNFKIQNNLRDDKRKVVLKMEDYLELEKQGLNQRDIAKKLGASMDKLRRNKIKWGLIIYKPRRKK